MRLEMAIKPLNVSNQQNMSLNATSFTLSSPHHEQSNHTVEHRHTTKAFSEPGKSFNTLISHKVIKYFGFKAYTLLLLNQYKYN